MRYVMPLAGFVALTLAACAATPTTPQAIDAAAVKHEQSANANDQLAAKEAAKFDPNARATKNKCTGRSARDEADVEVCWTSTINPTADYLKRAERYHKLAEQQRAASQKLREAEGGACVGVSEEDRSMSPFSHSEDVAIVTPLKSAVPPNKPEGASIIFRSTIGMTAPRLEKLVACQLSRNACLDNNTPDADYCPLALKDVRATVTTTTDGLFAVAIRSDNPAVAQEVLRRAQALLIH